MATLSAGNHPVMKEGGRGRETIGFKSRVERLQVFGLQLVETMVPDHRRLHGEIG
jgi:hypothetical protein